MFVFFLFINLVKKKRKKSNHIWFKPKFENARERQRNTISLNCLVWIWFCKKFDQVLFWRQVNIYIWEKNYWRDHPAVGTIFWLTELVKYKKKDWLYFLISFFLFFFLPLMKKVTSHYEPISNIDEDYLNSCSPVELLQGIHNSYRRTYKYTIAILVT